MDLKDAYLHITVHPDSRTFVRIGYQNRIFHFQALHFGPTEVLFGRATAPYMFNRIV